MIQPIVHDQDSMFQHHPVASRECNAVTLSITCQNMKLMQIRPLGAENRPRTLASVHTCNVGMCTLSLHSLLIRKYVHVHAHVHCMAITF